MSKITKSIFIFLTFFLGFFAYQNVNADTVFSYGNIGSPIKIIDKENGSMNYENSFYTHVKSWPVGQWWPVSESFNVPNDFNILRVKVLNGATCSDFVTGSYGGIMFPDGNVTNTIYGYTQNGSYCDFTFYNNYTYPAGSYGGVYLLGKGNNFTDDVVLDGDLITGQSGNGLQTQKIDGGFYFSLCKDVCTTEPTSPVTEPESGVISILVNGKLPEFNTETPITIKVIFNNLEEDNYKFIKYLIEDNNDPTKYLMGEKEISKIGLLKDESFTSNFFEENKTYTGSFFLSKFSGNSGFPGDTDTVNFTITTKDIVSINGIFSSLPDYEDFECEIGLTSMTGENLMNCGKRMVAWVFLPDYGTKEKVQKMILENEDTILYLPWTLLNNFTDTSDTLGEATVTLPFVGETEIVGDNFQIPYNWDNLGKILLWSIFVSMWGWFFIRKLFF